MADLAIEVRGLQKSYGDVMAVDGVDLAIGTGEVFALLGPNGAGKTTTIEILEGFRPRSAGDVCVLGHDPQRGDRALKERVGIVLQTTGLDPYLTAGETIDMFRSYYPNPHGRDDVLELVGLTDARGKRVGKLSGGQKRRLDVAVGLSGNPDLLFLDEPTTGFDPSARREAWDMIRNLKALGATVLLTTHYLDEAQQLADRVAIIVSGRIVAEGPPSTLVAGSLGTTVRFGYPADISPPPWLPIASPGVVEIQSDRPTELLHRVTSWALEHDVELVDLSVRRPTLEDVYLELTDKSHG
jgi:ABC-2 type transport system ATP-binding protein